MSAAAPIARVDARVAQPEKQRGSLVNIGGAAHALGISCDEVVALCKAGKLRAQLMRGRFWLIDEVFLNRWHEANQNVGAAARELKGASAAATLASRAPCPSDACSAHWERCGRIVSEFRVNLCRACYSGRPLPVKPDVDASQD